MDDIEFLRGRLPGYAGYHDEENRHLVDSQVRAWLGEALADLRARLQPEGELLGRLDDLVFRCEFADQRTIRATDHGFREAETAEALYAADRAIVELADRARGAEAGAVPALLDEISGGLDARTGILNAAAAREPAR